ncbi:MAG: hypothetical protein R3E93_10270 [Thiothrix sp.]
MKSLEILLGSLLLLLVMGVDVAAIKALFPENNVTVLLVSLLLALECLFMLSYHYHALRKPVVVPTLTRWNKRFQVFFLVLTLCSVGVFAADSLGLLDGYRPVMQLVFWVLFAGLVMLGAGLALYALLDEPESAAMQGDDTAAEPAIQYGKAGYS